MRIPLRTTLVFVVLAFGITSAGIIWNEHAAARESESTATEDSLRIRLTASKALVENQLSSVREILTVESDSISSRGPATASDAYVMTLLDALIAAEPIVESAYFFDADGSLSGVRQQDIRREAPQNDSLSGGIFLLARNADGFVWTEPHVDRVTGTPVLTGLVATRTLGGDLIGVLGVDIDLLSLSKIIASSSETEKATVVVFDEDFQVIAHSAPESLTVFDQVTETSRLSFLMETGDPWAPALQNLSQVTSKNELPFNSPVEIDVESTKYRVVASSLDSLPWEMWVVNHGSTESGPVTFILRNLVWILMAFILVLSGSFLMRRELFRPIRLLRDQGLALKRDRTLPAAVCSIFTEIDTMVVAVEEAHHLVENRIQNNGRLLAEETRIRRQAELRSAEISEAKTDFIAGFEREARSRLDSIVENADLLASGSSLMSLEEISLSALTIADAGRNLRELVDRVLGISEIESGSFRLEEDPVSVSDLIEFITQSLENEADSLGLRLELVDRTDAKFTADSGLLKQGVLNLVSNALNFTPEGGTVRFVANRTEDGGTRIRITDTGIGMSPAEITVALSMFGRVHQKAGTRRGIGLGLYATEKIVEAHGGTLTLESQKGVGTSATIEIPPWRTIETPLTVNRSSDEEESLR